MIGMILQNEGGFVWNPFNLLNSGALQLVTFFAAISGLVIMALGVRLILKKFGVL